MAVQVAEDDEETDNLAGEPEHIELIALDHENRPVKKVKRPTDVVEWDSPVMKVESLDHFISKSTSE